MKRVIWSGVLTLTSAPTRGGPVSYAVKGKQYIVIPTGLGSHAPGFLASRASWFAGSAVLVGALGFGNLASFAAARKLG